MTCQKSEIFVWKKIEKIEVVGYDGPVYNLHVGGPECFVAEGVVVHNCPHDFAVETEGKVDCAKLWRGG